MLLNGYAVKLNPGKEIIDNNGCCYVEMNHATQYTITLLNNHDAKCNVELFIDGKDQGVYRVNSYSQIILETTPKSNGGKFTAYKTDSKEGRSIGLTNNNESGLIKVVFTPEKKIEGSRSAGIYKSFYDDLEREPLSYGSIQNKGISRSMGTGLSGNSDQYFSNAEQIPLDYSKQTTIYIRLKCVDDEPRPLVDHSRSTPVPPPLY